MSSYRRLSRRGMREALEYGLAGFLYVPFREAEAAGRLDRHHAMAIVYAPANWVDRQHFEGDGTVECVIWRLSG